MGYKNDLLKAKNQSRYAPKTHTVKQGQSWFSIAGEVYGDQRYAGELANANPDINTLKAGQVIKLPNPAMQAAIDAGRRKRAADIDGKTLGPARPYISQAQMNAWQGQQPQQNYGETGAAQYSYQPSQPAPQQAQMGLIPQPYYPTNTGQMNAPYGVSPSGAPAPSVQTQTLTNNLPTVSSVQNYQPAPVNQNIQTAPDVVNFPFMPTTNLSAYNPLAWAEKLNQQPANLTGTQKLWNVQKQFFPAPMGHAGLYVSQGGHPQNYGGPGWQMGYAGLHVGNQEAGVYFPVSDQLTGFMQRTQTGRTIYHWLFR